MFWLSALSLLLATSAGTAHAQSARYTLELDDQVTMLVTPPFHEAVANLPPGTTDWWAVAHTQDQEGLPEHLYAAHEVWMVFFFRRPFTGWVGEYWPPDPFSPVAGGAYSADYAPFSELSWTIGEPTGWSCRRFAARSDQVQGFSGQPIPFSHVVSCSTTVGVEIITVVQYSDSYSSHGLEFVLPRVDLLESPSIAETRAFVDATWVASLHQRFPRLDTDGDGRLSDAEWVIVAPEYDTDGDGAYDVEEHIAVCRASKEGYQLRFLEREQPAEAPAGPDALDVITPTRDALADALEQAREFQALARGGEASPKQVGAAWAALREGDAALFALWKTVEPTGAPRVGGERLTRYGQTWAEILGLKAETHRAALATRVALAEAGFGDEQVAVQVSEDLLALLEHPLLSWADPAQQAWVGRVALESWKAAGSDSRAAKLWAWCDQHCDPQLAWDARAASLAALPVEDWEALDLAGFAARAMVKQGQVEQAQAVAQQCLAECGERGRRDSAIALTLLALAEGEKASSETCEALVSSGLAEACEALGSPELGAALLGLHGLEPPAWLAARWAQGTEDAEIAAAAHGALEWTRTQFIAGSVWTSSDLRRGMEGVTLLEEHPEAFGDAERDEMSGYGARTLVRLGQLDRAEALARGCLASCSSRGRADSATALALLGLHAGEENYLGTCEELRALELGTPCDSIESSAGDGLLAWHQVAAPPWLAGVRAGAARRAKRRERGAASGSP